MNYAIKVFELRNYSGCFYLCNENKAIIIQHPKMIDVLKSLSTYSLKEITDNQIQKLAEHHHIDAEQLCSFLIGHLGILKPLTRTKIRHVRINSDIPEMTDMLAKTLSSSYQIHITDTVMTDHQEPELVIMLRKEYTHLDLDKVYQNIGDNQYLITAGVIHQFLIIDNIFYKKSGLPTHLDQKAQLLQAMGSAMPIGKNNWMSFYRKLMQANSDHLPAITLNPCQMGYAAACLYQFSLKLIDVWSDLALFDQLNWTWHVDLNALEIHKAAAVHSPWGIHESELTHKQHAEAAVES